jgi:hypothetical protein
VAEERNCTATGVVELSLWYFVSVGNFESLVSVPFSLLYYTSVWAIVFAVVI